MNSKYIKASLIMLLLTCSVAMGQKADKGVVIDKIIAKVDDYIVLKSELEKGYMEFMSRGEITQGDVKCQILESLVINKLMVAKAELDSVEVMDIQVEQELGQRMSYFIQQIGSEEKLEEVYGKTVAQFREELFDQIKEQMIVRKMQGLISADVSITPSEVKSFFKKIPSDSLPYFSTEVTIGHLVKIPEPNDKVKDQIRLELLEFKDQIENGMDFGVLASKYSMDPGSARQGGELGFFNRGELAPEFEAAALGMKPGEISEPVETQFGFHLIQLIERRGNRYNSRHILLIPKATQSDIQESKDFLDSLRTSIVRDSMRFDILAKEHSDDKQTSGNGGYFSDADGAMRISVEELDPTMFFTIDTMKVGEVSKPFEYKMPDGKAAVRIVYYRAKIPPHQANLLDDYQKIRSAALANKRNGIMSDWFKGAQGEVYINIDEEYDYCRILLD
ncbi:periplasmic chaperone for outer membrane proteins SurA [Reichenbachiella agariperforans]|uniref:Periplasmic chaperone for outer membrane proteins SurA n=1 Tax=Reichenbachiella agariperforans TaxID=156994 RepID=A0A1M6TS63_REIAG|nr:peptidylprolyl isomerase [Reichenbachiella agariperforans]SHK59753.1 periplasmic chaperone for outer membrane proteins SurA [Reichenbachiella agariperforans]